MISLYFKLKTQKIVKNVFNVKTLRFEQKQLYSILIKYLSNEKFWKIKFFTQILLRNSFAALVYLKLK